MRCSMRSITTASSLLLLAACAHAPAPEPAVQYRDAAIAVAVGCVVDRPAQPVPLSARVSAAEWAARAPGAKAQAVRAQAGRRLNYEDAEAAATAGCPAAPSR
jgi:hypothetical protein